MHSRFKFSFLLNLCSLVLVKSLLANGDLSMSDFRAHDPFIVADKATRTYYLYTSVTNGALPRGKSGVVTYKSTDLEKWEGPNIVFEVPEDGWANPAHGAWAPEVHFYNGKYYLFVTLHNQDKVIAMPPESWRKTHMRATQIFVSDSPDGPFEAIADKPTTPPDLMTLDGTLFVEDGKPWIVYCHEWIQTIDGTFEAMELKQDFSQAIGKPKLLFRASEAPWITPWQAKATDQPREFVSDGAFLYRTKSGRLLMLWSSWLENHKYCETIAYSLSGRLSGPWRQMDPILTDHSGHGMIFEAFDGRLMLVVHHPTMSPESRAKLYELEDTGDTIRIKNPPEAAKKADNPLYRDPVFDAPTDPVICYNKEKSCWYMFYTSRRATDPQATGVSWVHGTEIGIAQSKNNGATWQYLCNADIGYNGGISDCTYWAPEVIYADGLYHMYLTFVPGVFDDWNHPRNIVHLTSKDMIHWKHESVLDLDSNKVIDACVIQLRNGIWRMWYKNEREDSRIFYADSKDLYNWQPMGKALADPACEGPKVFSWENKYWMITDTWRGQGVWSSDDCLNWARQSDNLFGSHGDVIVSDDSAYFFYFAPLPDEIVKKDNLSFAKRRNAIYVSKLSINDGKLSQELGKPTYIKLANWRENER